LELAHVAHVEEPDGAANRSVLLDDPGVLHRHLPATERHHARAGRDVLVIERRALERRGVHAFGKKSRTGLTWQPARSSAPRTVRAVRSYVPDVRASRSRSRPDSRAASATAVARGSSFSIIQ